MPANEVNTNPFRVAFQCLQSAQKLTSIFTPKPKFDEAELNLIRILNEKWFQTYSKEMS